MQGKKHYQPQIFIQFNLAEFVPENNFYRKLKEQIDWRFLYPATKKYYGEEGNPSIDPVVFFKLLLFGYLENIESNRKIVEHAGMRMDVKFYINYDLEEKLPWHSTLARTRQLYGEEVFRDLFKQVLKQCAEAGMVAGHTQAVDSVFVKANASMDSLEVKQPTKKLEEYLNDLTEEEVTTIDNRKNNRAEKHLSNSTHASSTDPDARISVKPGKTRQLNYLGQVSVDSQDHIITNACADYADKKDSQSLEGVIKQTKENLQENGIELQNIVADTNYSSGDAYAYLEQAGITGYIPVAGAFDKNRTEQFRFDTERRLFICPNHKEVKFKKQAIDKRGNSYQLYATSVHDCKGCALKETCLGKTSYKSMKLTAHWQQYQTMYKRIQTPVGKQMLRLRKSTVEHVLGTMVNFYRTYRVNERGIAMANKHILLGAIAYNIKKLIAHLPKAAASMALNLQKRKQYMRKVLGAYFSNLNQPWCQLVKAS